MQPQCDNKSMLKLGQAIAATLPTTVDDLKAESQFMFHISELQTQLFANHKPDEGKPSPLYMVYVRNRLLNMLANFLSHSSAVHNQHMSEQIVKVLGFDWILSLLSPGVHKGTVFLALRILLILLAHPHLLLKFREGTGSGGWLADADSVVRNRAAVVLGFSVSAHGGSIGSKIDINPELQHCAGFAALEHLMAAHAEKPHVYLAMLSILVGQPVKDLRFCEQFNMDVIWTHVFGLSLTSSVYEAVNSVEFCYDAIIPLFSMIRGAIYCENEDTNAMGMRSETTDRKEVSTPDLVCTKESGQMLYSIVENGATRRSQIVILTALIHAVFINISYMCIRVVDALWNGLIVDDPLRLLNSLYHIYSVANRKEYKTVNVSNLTSSIMRCVLFILSRPIDAVQVQMWVLDTLSSIISKRYIYLSSNEPWFFSSLTHLIFMLSVTPDILERNNAPLERASAQVAICASRVWTDVILAKKTLLEETFKKTTVSELNAARALLAHSAGVHWHQFVDSQLHANNSYQTTTKDLQQQISSVGHNFLFFMALPLF
uniref:Non-specific serine/threonine protein kinase n=1 Tax=Heterorhabditis bacteriophora TaxID=37862 RepID=A0A1I7XL43_HETBA